MDNKPSLITQDLQSFIPMVQAVLKKQYKMPWGLLFWTILCLFYFASPIDFVPDFLPLLGFADDGAFIIFILVLWHNELGRFRATYNEKEQPTIIEAEVIHDDKEGEQ